MSDIFIIGMGMIRFNKYPEGTVRGMAHDAVRLVLQDAGLTKDDIQAAYVSNTFWGMFSNQHSIRGEVMLWDLGMDRIPIVNCENACAGASTALYLGYTAIKAGMFDVVLALGSEKITNPNKALSLGAYATCMDVENFAEHIKMFEELNQRFQVKIPEGQTPPGEGRSIFHGRLCHGCQVAHVHVRVHSETACRDLLEKSYARVIEPPGPVPEHHER